MDRKFILLTYKESTKKIVLHVQEENLYQFVKNQVKDKFGLDMNNLHAQYFDTDVQDYVDFEDGCLTTEEVDKIIKIILKESIKTIPGIEQLDGSSEPIAGISNSPLPANSDTHCASISSRATTTSCTPASMSQRPTTPCTPASMSPVPESPSSSELSKPSTSSTINVETKSKRNWPRIYNFPVSHLPAALRLKLDEKTPLERIDRKRLLEVLYTDVTSYDRGLYPSPDMYDQIVDALLRQYPHLISEGGIPLHSVRVFWKDRLKFKWGNERKSRDKNLPEVKAKKRKTEERSTSVEEKGNVLTWGMANYLPPTLESEDEVATERHIEWLKTHVNRQEKDGSLVNLKMNLCFPERRRDIVINNMSISEILEKYPFLKDMHQILLEFARLGPSFSGTIDEVLHSSLDEYGHLIVALVKNRKVIPQLKEILTIIPEQRTVGEREYATKCAAILGSGQLFKEKFEKIICKSEEEPTDSAVALVIHDTILTLNNNMFELKIEGETIFKCDTFLELFIGFLASIYCFNLAYPKPIVKTLTFFQHVFLKLNDGNLDKKIVSVVSELNKEKSKKK